MALEAWGNHDGGEREVARERLRGSEERRSGGAEQQRKAQSWGGKRKRKAEASASAAPGVLRGLTRSRLGFGDSVLSPP